MVGQVKPSRLDLILSAQRKGFRVVESEEHGGWCIEVPRKPRLPAHVQAGGWRTSDRAWSVAAALALEWPE